MKNQNTIVILCFAIAVICAVVMLPLSAELVSLPQEDLASPDNTKWILACVLGVVGLTSALTGKRLSDRKSND